MTHLPPRRGFTLVELLVVITIIGILVAILVPSVYIVRKQVLNGSIAFEINGLEQAINAYKLESGGAPPPNFIPNDRVQLGVRQHLLKRYPRMPKLMADNLITIASDPATFMDPHEAMVFWLGVQSRNGGLRNNPTQPFQLPTGTGEVKEYYAFEKGRLIDSDNDGWLEYASPYSQNAPYVYFDARYYNRITAAFPVMDTVNSVNRGKVAPYFTRMDTTTNPPKRIWANPETFQIISAGQDGMFEDPDVGNPAYAGSMPYPEGPYQDTGERDNLANFSENHTFQDAIP